MEDAAMGTPQENKNMVKRTIVISVGMSFFMSVGMSFVMTAANMGFSELFVGAWLRGVGIGFLASLPLSFLIPALMGKLCDKLFG
jgi:hypothetical protein